MKQDETSPRRLFSKAKAKITSIFGVKHELSVKEFLILNQVRAEDPDLKVIPKPDFILGVRTPKDINDISIKDFYELCSIHSDEDLLFKPCEYILGIKKDRIPRIPAYKAVGFSLWAIKEIERVRNNFKYNANNDSKN